MQWKLLAFILIVSLVVVFIGFNLGNSCDISIVFYTIKNVSVVVTIMCSFVLGLLSALLLTFGKKNKNTSENKIIRENSGISIPKKKNIKKTETTGNETTIDSPAAK